MRRSMKHWRSSMAKGDIGADLFADAKAARLRPDDMAKLMKVSRVTASLWFNGHSKPHHLLESRCTKILASIKAAMKDGDFPVPHDIGRRERALYIKQKVVKHIKPGL
jgi:hypothetical protein